MKDPHISTKHTKASRVEHIDVAEGDRHIRWLIINRGIDTNDHGAGYCTQGDGVNLVEKGAFQVAFDLVKRKLSSWR